MASPQPRIGVVTYPGLAGRPRRALGARRARRRGGPGLARGARAARPRRGRAARRLLVRRLPALRRDRALLAGDGGGARVRRRGRARARDLQRLPDPLRGRAPARACSCGTSRSRFVCRDVPLVVERDDLPFTSRCTQGRRIVIPVKHGDGRWFAPPSSRASSRQTARSCCATARRATARSTTSPASATSAATSWGSCRIPSTRSIRCSAPPTARSSSPRSSSRARARARHRSRRRRDPERLRKRRVLRERRSQPLDVARAERYRPAPCRSAGRVREADEPLAARGLEQLHDRGEPPLARLLRHASAPPRAPPGPTVSPPCPRAMATTLRGKVSRMCDAFPARFRAIDPALAEAADAGIDVEVVDLPVAVRRRAASPRRAQTSSRVSAGAEPASRRSS